MKVPLGSIPSPLRLFRGLVVAFLLVPIVLADRLPAPQQRIALQDLGFQPLNTQFLLNGSSMLTVHYVDDKHLLVTFTVRRLLRRLPDDPADDQDRSIDAVLLELPTGHVLARTVWRTHDHGQYLWGLGHGDFLLRIRDTLTIFSPLANLAAGHPFEERALIKATGRRVAAILLSPDADLMMVETVAFPTAQERHEALLGPIADPPALKARNPVQINFYRVARNHGIAEPALAGVARAAQTGDIAANSAGYLATIDQGHQHWAFDFRSYSGKVDELAPFDSTCSPVPILVSHSEFIAFGCHLGQGMHTMGGFNMRGEEMWEQTLQGEYLSPSLVFAPSNGRFALGRILTRSEFLPDQPISSDLVSSQTVVVMQASSGRQLLKVDCSPIERAGQNFALSPDGLSLAVIRADAIEIYPLPAPTEKERSSKKLAEASAPRENTLPIRLSERAEAQAESTGEAEPESPVPAVADDPAREASENAAARSTSAAAATQAQTSLESKPAGSSAEGTAQSRARQATEGDNEPAAGEHRKPPTLYTLPTDAPGKAAGADSSHESQPSASPQ